MLPSLVLKNKRSGNKIIKEEVKEKERKIDD